MESFLVPINFPIPEDDTNKRPKLILSVTSYKKMRYWVKSSRFEEISGLGTVTRKYNGLYVHDIYLMKPVRFGGGHVDMDPKAIDTLMLEWLSRGKDTRNLKLLWHSHVNFDTFWSTTDDYTAKEIFCPDANWTINLVTNQKGHFLARQDFPKSKKSTIHNLPVYLLINIDSSLGKKYKMKYKELYEDLVLKEFY